MRGIMAVAVSRITLFRIVAVLLLIIGSAQVYACDIADACVTGAPGQSSDCDQPLGDNCLCCCHHVVPVTIVTLETADCVCDEAPSEVILHTASLALPIEHPPQL